MQSTRSRVDRLNMSATIDAIRRHYDEQLTALGFLPSARRTVNFPVDNPYYDVLLASRHPRGLDLWNKTNPVPVDPQLSLLDDGDEEVPGSIPGGGTYHFAG